MFDTQRIIKVSALNELLEHTEISSRIQEAIDAKTLRLCGTKISDSIDDETGEKISE